LFEKKGDRMVLGFETIGFSPSGSGFGQYRGALETIDYPALRYNSAHFEEGAQYLPKISLLRLA
jgi:hypothetical protein